MTSLDDDVDHTSSRSFRQSFFSLANQLRYGPIFFITLLLLVVTPLLIFHVFQMRQRQLDQFHQEIGRRVSLEIENGLQHRVQDLRAVSHWPDLMAEPAAVQQQALAMVSVHTPGYRRLTLFDTDLRRITSLGIDSEVEAGMKPVWDALHRKEDFWWQLAKGDDTAVLLMIIMPVRGDDGQIRGYLQSITDLNALRSPFTLEVEQGDSEDLIIYLLDREDRQLILDDSGEIRLQPLETHPDEEGLLTGAGDQLGGWYQIFDSPVYRGLAEEPVLRRTADVSPLGWSLILEQSLPSAYQPFIRLLEFISLTTALALFGSILFGLILTRQVVSPLNRLTTAANRLSRGELGLQIPIQGQTELDMLAHTFNQMSRRLAELVNELEERVAERTRILDRRSLQIQAAAATARDATAAYDLDELLDRAVNLVPSRFGYYHAGIFLLDDDGKYAVLRAATGPVGRQMLAGNHKLQVGEEGIVGYVTATGEPYITPDTHRDDVYWPNPLLPHTRSEMGLPLKVEDKVIGAMNVQSQMTAAFDEEDIAILQILTDQLAVAIEKTRLFKRTQAMLEERLRTVVSNTPVILFALDEDGIITLAEGYGLALLGMEDTDFVGRSAQRLLRYAAPHTLDYLRRAQAGEPVEAVMEVGDLSWDVRMLPMRGEGETVTGVIGVATDVTDRENALRSLARKEAQLRQIIDLVPHMIFAKDSDGCFLLANRALADMYQIPISRLIGLSHHELHPNAAEVQRYLANDRAVIEQGKPMQIREEVFTDAAGEEHILQTSKIPFLWDELAETAVLGVSVEITGRKQAEAALRQAQKLESLGVLAGGVAHDFNNLLVAILGQTSLALVRLPPESPARRQIEKATRAAERAAELTRQLLAYSGRGHFEVVSLNLNTLITENLHLFELAVSRSVHLRSELTRPLPLIEADAGQIQQVIMNLILNGAEAIGEDETGTVTVTTGVEEIGGDEQVFWQYTGESLRPGLYVSLEVHDTGEGMNEETLAKIFDPFFTTKKAGRGLGLAAVLGIVRGHKGGIRVYSEPGKGTAFRVLFPAAETAPPQPAPEVVVDDTAVTAGAVLVIDDERDVREAVGDILAQENIPVLTAPGGEAGLALYQERRDEIALVLLDLTMPGMSGEDTFRALRRRDPEIQVILSSGYNKVEATRRFLGKGLAGFMQKPYSAQRLVHEVKQRLQLN